MLRNIGLHHIVIEEEWRHSSTYSNPRHWKRVSAQINKSTVLTTSRETYCAFDRMLVGPQRRSGCFEVEKYRFLYRNWKIGPPSSSPSRHADHAVYNVGTAQILAL
jgi:hypothetical protein